MPDPDRFSYSQPGELEIDNTGADGKLLIIDEPKEGEEKLPDINIYLPETK